MINRLKLRNISSHVHGKFFQWNNTPFSQNPTFLGPDLIYSHLKNLDFPALRDLRHCHYKRSGLSLLNLILGTEFMDERAETGSSW
jgi:hypothetical protein